jgi:hypothetical protein
MRSVSMGRRWDGWGADGTVCGRGLLLGAPRYGRGWIGWVRGEVRRVARGAWPVWVLVSGERGRRTDGLMRGLVGPRARRGRGKAGTPWRPGCGGFRRRERTSARRGRGPLPLDRGLPRRAGSPDIRGDRAGRWSLGRSRAAGCPVPVPLLFPSADRFPRGASQAGLHCRRALLDGIRGLRERAPIPPSRRGFAIPSTGEPAKACGYRARGNRAPGLPSHDRAPPLLREIARNLFVDPQAVPPESSRIPQGSGIKGAGPLGGGRVGPEGQTGKG